MNNAEIIARLCLRGRIAKDGMERVCFFEMLQSFRCTPALPTRQTTGKQEVGQDSWHAINVRGLESLTYSQGRFKLTLLNLLSDAHDLQFRECQQHVIAQIIVQCVKAIEVLDSEEAPAILCENCSEAHQGLILIMPARVPNQDMLREQLLGFGKAISETKAMRKLKITAGGHR